jgi:retron-type reverse transcriptase
MAEGWLHGKSNPVPHRGGTPQGGIISPTLANLTLDGLETLLNNLPHEACRTERRSIQR